MEYIETLLEQNKAYATDGFVGGLTMLPKKRTMIIACVDPRVDPAEVLKIKNGDAAIIRNVGGRITPATLETLKILRVVSKAAGEEVGPGWNIVLLQHTNCGIVNCLHHAPGFLAESFGVPLAELGNIKIENAYEAVAFDIAAMEKNPNLPKGVTVTGLVYDVTNGRIERVSGPRILGN